MSRRWGRRRKRFDPWFGDFFEEADRMEKMLDDILRQAFASPTERGKARRRYVYQFGNFPPRGSRIIEEYEPLVDVFVDETNVVIVVELPGVDKDHIEVYAAEDKVTISVNSPKRKYFKELDLPAKVDPRFSVTSYKNGVLELRLKKLVGERLFIK